MRLKNAVCTVINAVVIGWKEARRNQRWFNAYLEAPQDLIDTGRVVVGTGLQIARFNHTDSPIIEGGYDADTQNYKPANYYAIAVDRMWPDFVSFSQVGHDFGMKFEEAIKIAQGFVGLEYSGRFTFYSDACDNKEFDNPERCEINMGEWRYHLLTGGFGQDIIVTSPAVRLEYFEQNGGKLENLQYIIKVCQQLGYEQFEPEIPAEPEVPEPTVAT
ncbi:MAG TPA: hypothetical protein VJJ80_01045 [Patescibacteria group bacterium]|nr:hypothetical protein [Patescibacteria group bacterium]